MLRYRAGKSWAKPKPSHASAQKNMTVEMRLSQSEIRIFISGELLNPWLICFGEINDTWVMVGTLWYIHTLILSLTNRAHTCRRLSPPFRSLLTPKMKYCASQREWDKGDWMGCSIYNNVSDTHSGMRTNLLWINFRFAEWAKHIVATIMQKLCYMIMFVHTLLEWSELSPGTTV